MTKEEKEFEKVQGEAIELIKNKKGNKMNKSDKAPKTYTVTFTFWQLIARIVLVISLLGIGAYSALMIEKAITGTINQQVKEQTAEQVKSFTEAVEVKK